MYIYTQIHTLRRRDCRLSLHTCPPSGPLARHDRTKKSFFVNLPPLLVSKNHGSENAPLSMNMSFGLIYARGIWAHL